METAAVVFLFAVMTVGIVAMVTVAAILRGWALSILWGWFAVPIFNLPPLGVAQAIAGSVIVGMLTHQYIPSKDKDVWQPVFNMIAGPFLVLGIGWIIKGYL